MRILAEDGQDYKGDYGYNNHNNYDTKRKLSFEISGSLASSSPRAFSPLMLVESISRKSFSYGKLPLAPIKLTVLKLDGSSFDITVMKKATVAELKQAVETAFNHLPKHGVGKVSWSHVWGQFCLCFEGQKLLHDRDLIGLYGIHDGDQLQFERHASIRYNLVKERSEKQDSDSEESEASPSKQESCEHMQQTVGDNHSNCDQDYQNQQNHDENEEKESYEDMGVNVTCQCSWGHLLRRLFSYRKLKGNNTRYEDINSLCSSNSSRKVQL